MIVKNTALLQHFSSCCTANLFIPPLYHCQETMYYIIQIAAPYLAFPCCCTDKSIYMHIIILELSQAIVHLDCALVDLDL